MSDGDHECFGCGKPIADYQPHIHFTLDEWAVRQGQEALGLGDLFTLAFCEPCTQETDDGWALESHEVGDEP